MINVVLGLLKRYLDGILEAKMTAGAKIKIIKPIAITETFITIVLK